MEKLLGGIEKFGLESLNELEIYKKEEEAVSVESAMPKEFLIDKFIYKKEYKCEICSVKFMSDTLRTGKMRPVAIDHDLRPIYEEPIHPIFYDIVVCPTCGHAALTQTVSNMRPSHARRVLSDITPRFKYVEYPAMLDVDMALERYKLALLNAVVKDVKDSEKAYLCMKIAWLYRSKQDKKNELSFISNAYKGYISAYEKEYFPIFGMEESVVVFLIASYAKALGHLEDALKFVGQLIMSRTLSKRMRDRAIDLKQDILHEMKARNEANTSE